MTESASRPATVGSDVVDISVPMRTEFIATLRTVAASIGADAGFSIDEIDDLRLAISEVVSSLTDREGPIGREAHTGAADDRIEVSFRAEASRVEVTITTRSGDVAIELDQLASSILNSVADQLVVDGASVTLVKLASETANPIRSDAEPAAPAAPEA